MIFAYADPPYPGNAHRYAERQEVDHYQLLKKLNAEYPDGWALSTGSNNLSDILVLARDLGMKPRIGSWVKPFAVFKPNVGVAYAWEPVLFIGGRKRTRQQPTVRDWVSVNITLKKGLVGAKPPEFCAWILDILNFQLGDILDDLYPGTGIMERVVNERCVLISAG